MVQYPPGFQVTLSEAEYCANVPRLSAQLSAEHVRGVHEDALPLALNAAHRLGCVVQVGIKAGGALGWERRGGCRMGNGYGNHFLPICDMSLFSCLIGAPSSAYPLPSGERLLPGEVPGR